LEPVAGRAAASALPFSVEMAGERALLQRDLDRYDAVLLCNVGRWTEGEAAVLRRYVAEGGTLVFFLGDQTDLESYNRRLAAPVVPRRSTAGRETVVPILPGRLVERVASPEGMIDPLEYRHPMLRAFRGAGGVGLHGTPVTRYFQVAVDSARDATVVLRVADSSDPLLIEQPVGRGRVVLMTTAIRADWTALPLLPSFVPLMQEMLGWCLAVSGNQSNVLVDQRPAVEGASFHSDRLDPGQLTSGFFTVRDEASQRETLYAANVDPRESDLRVAGAAKVRRLFADRVTIRGAVSSPTGDTSAGSSPPGAAADAPPVDTISDQSAHDSARLPIALLAVALGLALLETLWSARLARSQVADGGTLSDGRRTPT
jgi:uncharacterized membrane protein